MSECLAGQQRKPGASSFLSTRSATLQRRCACGGTVGPDGECAACRAKHLALRHVAAAKGGPTVAPPIVGEVLRSPGTPLDAATRAVMEPRFGHDFGRVRVHTDARATESARAVGALAYTVGRDIVFGGAHYAPTSSAGRRLIAHELAHVVQQNRAPAPRDAAHIPIATSPPYEREAEAAAAIVGEHPGTDAAGGAIRARAERPALMALAPSQFRTNLGSTPQQAAAIRALFADATFKAIWDWLAACSATPQQDLGPLALKVTPGLTIGGVERFGGYSPVPPTLEINPTKPEHRDNPAELVDTIVHELIHAADDLQTSCTAAGAPAAPLAGAVTTTEPTSRAAVAGIPDEARLAKELGPGASNPCEEFIDINATAQQMIVTILTNNIQVARVGRPTLTFVNVILRQDPAALATYEGCRTTACAKPTPVERRREIATCSADVIARSLPTALTPALLPAVVYFDSNADVPRADEAEKIKLIALFLAAHPGTSVELIGHADPVGSTGANLDLGQRRADAVKMQLVSGGVPAAQIRPPTSVGEASPRSTGPATRWLDRAVEIRP